MRELPAIIFRPPFVIFSPRQTEAAECGVGFGLDSEHAADHGSCDGTFELLAGAGSGLLSLSRKPSVTSSGFYRARLYRDILYLRTDSTTGYLCRVVHRRSHQTPLVASGVEEETRSWCLRAGVHGGARGLRQVSRIALSGLVTVCSSGPGICQTKAYVDSPSVEKGISADEVYIATWLFCEILSAPPVVITLPGVEHIPT